MTLHEAAELLGVHYMTAYRYVRLGLLQAAKRGGAWRVSREDIERMGQEIAHAKAQKRKGPRRARSKVKGRSAPGTRRVPRAGRKTSRRSRRR